ncbi:MAG: YbfB/YjiJ family MFS transporter [Deferrisomatales bacterium]
MGRRRIHYGWVVIFTGLLVTIGAHGFGRMSYTLILPAMRDGLGFSYTQLGLLEMGNFVGYLVMALVGGLLAARFGPRKVIAWALVLMALTLAGMGMARGFGFALGMRTVTGLGNGAAYVPAMALGAAWFSVRLRGLATGIVTAGIGAGTMIAGLVVPPILRAGGPEGWRTAWLALGAAVLGIAAVAAALLRTSPSEMGLVPIGAEGAEAAALPPKGARPAPFQWGQVYRQGRVWYLGFVYFMYGFSYIIYVTFFVAYLVKQRGFGPGEAGGLWALVGGLSTFCGLLWGGISDRIGRPRAAALAYAVLAAAYSIYALSPSRPGLYLSAALFGVTAWSVPTVTAAAAGDYVGPRLAPACLGFITLFFGIGQALGPAVGGALTDRTGGFVGAFLLAAGVSLVGALLSLALPRTAEAPR